MSKEAWKRLIVAIGGLVSAVVFALTNKDLDPGVMEKVLNAIIWIVTTYVAQSGLHSAVKTRSEVMSPAFLLTGARQSLGPPPSATKTAEESAAVLREVGPR
jgi:hypothetical protein